MTREQIEERIKLIQKEADDHDDEAAHSGEDKLRDDFLQFIADNSPEYGELAKLILSTNEISFARWCA